MRSDDPRTIATEGLRVRSSLEGHPADEIKSSSSTDLRLHPLSGQNGSGPKQSTYEPNILDGSRLKANGYGTLDETRRSGSGDESSSVGTSDDSSVTVEDTSGSYAKRLDSATNKFLSAQKRQQQIKNSSHYADISSHTKNYLLDESAHVDVLIDNGGYQSVFYPGKPNPVVDYVFKTRQQADIASQTCSYRTLSLKEKKDVSEKGSTKSSGREYTVTGIKHLDTESNPNIFQSQAGVFTVSLGDPKFYMPTTGSLEDFQRTKLYAMFEFFKKFTFQRFDIMLFDTSQSNTVRIENILRSEGIAIPESAYNIGLPPSAPEEAIKSQLKLMGEAWVKSVAPFVVRSESTPAGYVTLSESMGCDVNILTIDDFVATYKSNYTTARCHYSVQSTLGYSKNSHSTDEIQDNGVNGKLKGSPKDDTRDSRAPRSLTPPPAKVRSNSSSPNRNGDAIGIHSIFALTSTFQETAPFINLFSQILEQDSCSLSDSASVSAFKDQCSRLLLNFYLVFKPSDPPNYQNLRKEIGDDNKYLETLIHNVRIASGSSKLIRQFSNAFEKRITDFEPKVIKPNRAFISNSLTAISAGLDSLEPELATLLDLATVKSSDESSTQLFSTMVAEIESSLTTLDSGRSTSNTDLPDIDEQLQAYGFISFLYERNFLSDGPRRAWAGNLTMSQLTLLTQRCRTSIENFQHHFSLPNSPTRTVFKR